MDRALEEARAAKQIGHSLDASVTLGLPVPVLDRLRPYEDQLRSIFIVSSVSIVPAHELDNAVESEEIKGLKVRVVPSEDPKCERCWVHDATVGNDNKHPTACGRCLEALREMEQAAA